jgi:hypothetical protein
MNCASARGREIGRASRAHPNPIERRGQARGSRTSYPIPRPHVGMHTGGARAPNFFPSSSPQLATTDSGIALPWHNGPRRHAVNLDIFYFDLFIKTNTTSISNYYISYNCCLKHYINMTEGGTIFKNNIHQTIFSKGLGTTKTHMIWRD